MSSAEKRRRNDDEGNNESEGEAENNESTSANMDTSLAREGLEIPETLEEGAMKYRDIYIPPPPPSTCSFDSNGPRLVIKTIVVNNFKSFYGTNIIGPFFKGMNAVIGPNGSGKSNVLDSILFVFGYRASRIRTKKVSMLIHNSSQHTDLQSCSVTVNFIQIIDKGPDLDPEEIPNTELAVSRTAMRDNSSYYSMDGHRLQFIDVATRLRQHGVDLTNGRFLILQGEVEQIAQMKPKGETEHETGLLEFLEDIMGTLRYREPLEKALKYDVELEDVRLALSEQLNAVDKVLKALRPSKKEAIKYLQQENNVIRLEHRILQKNAKSSWSTKQAHEEEKAKLVEKVDEINNQLTEVRQKHKEFAQKTTEKGVEIEKMKKIKENMDAECRKNTNQDKHLQEQMLARNVRRKKMKENLKTEEKKLVELRGLPEKNSKEIAELETLIANHESKRTSAQVALDAAMTELKQEIREPQQKLEMLEQNLAVFVKQREEKSASLRIIQSKLKLCTKDESKQKEKLQTLQTNLNEINENLEQKERRMNELKKELPRAKENLAKVSKELDTKRGERARVDQRAAKLRKELQGVRTAADVIRSRNRVVAILMEQKANGNIKGIFGRLGDLGAVDAKYECAVSSSCGSLDHVVVDKVGTGELCINYLRDTGIGRCNLLVLEKLQSWGSKSRQPFSTPENLPRMFDLVRVEDERVLPAFYFAMRDTLVANDIEEASRIGHGGCAHSRVVDLSGNIMEPGGTITGGGNPIKGRIGQQVTAGLAAERAAEETPQLRQSLEQLEARSSTLMQNIIGLEQREREFRSKVPQLEAEARCLGMDIKHLADSVQTLTKQVSDQQEVVNKTNSDQRKVKQLQAELEASTKELQTAQEAAGKIEVKVEKLRTQMNEIKNQRVGGLDVKVKELTKKIDKAQADKTKLFAAIASVERNLQKSQEKATNLEQEIKSAVTEIEEMMETSKNIQRVAEQHLKEYQAYCDELLKHEVELNGMLKEQKALSSEEMKLKNKKHDAQEVVNKEDKLLQASNAKYMDFKNKMDNMKLEAVPDKLEEAPFHLCTAKELEAETVESLTYSIGIIRDAQPPRPNMAIIEECKNKEEQFVKMSITLEEAARKRNEARDFVNEIRHRRRREFMEGFEVINQKLKEVSRMISMGGAAELELQDTINPFLEGVIFSVRPRNKAWTQVDKLSGGEKTLSSLALLFCVHYYKPSPFYMMDEIDAALDTANVSIIGQYIQQFTTNCQFIVISLRPEMFDLFSRRVIGIYKPGGCSSTVTIDPGAFNKDAQKEDESESSLDTSANVAIDTMQEEVTTPKVSADQQESTTPKVSAVQQESTPVVNMASNEDKESTKEQSDAGTSGQGASNEEDSDAPPPSKRRVTQNHAAASTSKSSKSAAQPKRSARQHKPSEESADKNASLNDDDLSSDNSEDSEEVMKKQRGKVLSSDEIEDSPQVQRLTQGGGVVPESDDSENEPEK